MRKGKREAGGERRQAIDFKKAACCSSAVVEGQLGDNMVCARGVVRSTAIFDPTQPGSGRHNHVEAAVDWRSDRVC